MAKGEKHGKVIIDTPKECRKSETKLMAQSNKAKVPK